MEIAPRIQAAWEKTVALYRKPRSGAEPFDTGTSWIGGLPALGDVEWPHDANGQPMHHLMQIDLGEVAPHLDIPGLPTSGALVAFSSLGQSVSSYVSVLRYVARPKGPTAAPKGLTPIKAFGRRCMGDDPETFLALPKWGLKTVPMSSSTLNEKLRSRNYTDLLKSMPNGRLPSYWHSAQSFSRSLDLVFASNLRIEEFRASAKDAMIERQNYVDDGIPRHADREYYHKQMVRKTELAEKLIEYQPIIRDRINAIRDWAFAHGPWETMSGSDLERLKAEHEPFTRRWRQPATDELEFYQYSRDYFWTFGDMARHTLHVMITGPNEVFENLPELAKAELDRSLKELHPITCSARRP